MKEAVLTLREKLKKFKQTMNRNNEADKARKRAIEN